MRIKRKKNVYVLLSLTILLITNLWSKEAMSAEVTCQDFSPTPEAIERFPDLIGACESVVEKNGELFGMFKAVVRRASRGSVVLYLPATNHTFSLKPKSDATVMIGNSKVKARDLSRGQEIRIYLSANAFATPIIEEVILIDEMDEVVVYEVVTVAALPTTASIWPAAGLMSFLLTAIGLMMWRSRQIVLVESKARRYANNP